MEKVLNKLDSMSQKEFHDMLIRTLDESGIPYSEDPKEGYIPIADAFAGFSEELHEFVQTGIMPKCNDTL